MDGGDEPAFDYVVQAATGIAALTGDPDGPPTLPGYSSADNSTGLTAALGLLAQIISGRGGQVDVCLQDVMLSQLNYRASAYLNDGVEPRRYPFGAHSYYVPAQLFPTADGYLALFITHDAFWKLFAGEAKVEGFETMAERVSRRDDVLAVVTRSSGERHRQGLGGAAASARYPGRGGPLAAGGAGSRSRNRRHRRRIQARRQPDPRRGVYPRLPPAAGATSLVDDGHRLAVGDRLGT